MPPKPTYASAARQRRPPDQAQPNIEKNTTPLMIARKGCMLLHAPASTTLASIATALEAQSPGIQVSPSILNGRFLLQAVNQTVVDALVATGLKIGEEVALVTSLINSAKTTIIQLRITSFIHDNGTALLQSKLEEFGKVITLSNEFYPGTTISTNITNVLLDIEDSTKAPPAMLDLERDEWTETIKIQVVGSAKICYYCKSTTHIRKECTVAPACTNCSSTEHPSLYCKAPPAPKSTATITAPAPRPILNAPSTPFKRARTEPPTVSNFTFIPPSSASSTELGSPLVLTTPAKTKEITLPHQSPPLSATEGSTSSTVPDVNADMTDLTPSATPARSLRSSSKAVSSTPSTAASGNGMEEEL